MSDPPKNHYLLSGDENKKMFEITRKVAIPFIESNGDFLGIVQHGDYGGELSPEMKGLDIKDK